MNNAFDEISLNFDDINKKLEEVSNYLKVAAKLLVNRNDFDSAQGALELANRIDTQIIHR